MKTVICAIVKNEHKFIKEWVDYHLSIGIDLIYIFEDWNSDSHAELFTEDFYLNKVIIIPLSKNELNLSYKKTSNRLYELYCTFLEKCKKDNIYDWVLFIDIDEFLMFENNYNLEKLLSECSDYPAIWLCWKCYGANGYIKSPHPELGVLEAYTKPSNKSCDSKNQWNIKSFVNVKLCEGLNNLHEAIDGRLTNGKHYSFGLSYLKAWLNHYYSKSWEDYCERIFKRGNLDNNNRSFDQFFLVNEDLLPLLDELINSIRYNHAYDTMYISSKLKIISGGNINRLNELKQKYINGITFKKNS